MSLRSQRSSRRTAKIPCELLPEEVPESWEHLEDVTLYWSRAYSPETYGVAECESRRRSSVIKFEPLPEET